MCSPCERKPSDREILNFLAEHDFKGEINPEIARHVAADYLNVYPRSKEETALRLSPFLGEDGKILPLNVHQRKMLADLIFPAVDSS